MMSPIDFPINVGNKYTNTQKSTMMSPIDFPISVGNKYTNTQKSTKEEGYVKRVATK
jgi:hypothetical protein